MTDPQGIRGMAGDGHAAALPDHSRVIVVPSATEAQAHADNLRDMLAAGEFDQRVVRAAANALEAIAIADRGFTEGET